tara:strand:+ start:1579 stop:2115 length:537 start_codon:yes stop_codon:yes gene_type:complete
MEPGAVGSISTSVQLRSSEMAGQPRSAAALKSQHRIMSDPKTWDEIFRVIGAGESTKAVATHYQLPTGRMLSYIKGSSDLTERYDEARQARAMFHAERIEAIANNVEAGDLDAQAARVSLDARKFLASRLDPHLWGEKQRVDLTINDVTKQHLEAIRVLGMTENVLEHEDYSEKLIES